MTPNVIPPLWACTPDNVKRRHDRKGLPHPGIFAPYWEPTGNRAFDSSGNNRHITPGSAVIWNTTPEHGVGSDHPGGADSTTKISTFPSYEIGSEYTIVFQTYIVALNDVYIGGGTTNYVLFIDPAGTTWYHYADGTFKTFSSTSPAGSFRHFIISGNSASNIYCYMDGSLQGTWAFNGAKTLTLDTIGGYSDGTYPAEFFIYYFYVYEEEFNAEQRFIIKSEPYFALYPESFPTYFFGQPSGAAPGRTTKNTDPFGLGQKHGMSFRMAA